MRKFIPFFLLLSSLAFGQNDSVKRWTIYPLPIVFKSPETDFGFGAGGFVAFSWKDQSPQSKESQFSLGAAYTLNEQFLSYVNFNLYSPDGEWQTLGEAGYYNYFYYYWGLGPATTEAMQERYDVNFYRYNLNVLKRLSPNVWGGLRYWGEPYDVFSVEPGGLLDTEAPGGRGGLSSGIGIAFQYDSRDNLFFPRSGWFSDFAVQRFGEAIGSDFKFTKVYFDLSKYLPIGEDAMIGFNLYQEYSFGNVPFNQMSLIGGTKKLRGYYLGRFRDHHMLEFQTEVRFPTFWRLGMTVFAGVGQVWGPEHAFTTNQLKWNLGIGGRFRLNLEKKINARGDLGFGEKTSGTYITVGEAF